MHENEIISIKDYGRITLTLSSLMDLRGISRNALARRIGVRFEVIDKWYKGDVEKLDLDILARLCCVLGCGVEDILTYKN